MTLPKPDRTRAAALLCLALAAAAPAASQPKITVTQHNPLPTPDNGSPEAHGKRQPVYRLLGFGLRGTTRVDTDAIIATLPEHEGDVITNAEIRADADKITKVLDAAHVHGGIVTTIMTREGPGHHVYVVWTVLKEDALSYVPMHGMRHFASQTFTGNTALSTDALTAAAGLHAGDVVRDGTIGDARTGIEQAYDRALPGKPVTVAGKIKLHKDNTVTVDWQITEPH